MKRGFVPAMMVIGVITALIGLVVLTGIIEPMTTYSPTEGELMNLTGDGYLTPSISQFDSVRVFNNTDCVSDELVELTDYLVDTPYNGGMNNIQPVTGSVGNAITLEEGSYVVMETTTTKADLTGNLTIIGWVNPQDI